MLHVTRVGVAGVGIALATAGCAGTPLPSGAPPVGAGAPATDVGVAPVEAPVGSLPGPPVTAEEAQASALEAVGGGWILETKIEERDDDPDDDRDDDDWGGGGDFEPAVDVWEVTVVGPDDLRHTVSVDLAGGSVLDNRVDD